MWRLLSVAALFTLTLALSQGVDAGLARRQQILGFARQWLGTPYRWGGKTPRGIDCSAYLQRMYRKLYGISLPRTTRQQIRLGQPILLDRKRPTRNLRPGDLLFYVNAIGRPKHVVIYLGKGQITHSESGRGVVIDPIRRAFGRRLIARRLLVPQSAPGGRSRWRPPRSQAIHPREVVEIPCPKRTSVAPIWPRRMSRESIESLQPDLDLSRWDLCDLRRVAAQLRSRDTPKANANAERLELQAEMVENMEVLRDELDANPFR